MAVGSAVEEGILTMLGEHLQAEHWLLLRQTDTAADDSATIRAVGTRRSYLPHAAFQTLVQHHHSGEGDGTADAVAARAASCRNLESLAAVGADERVSIHWETES